MKKYAILLTAALLAVCMLFAASCAKSEGKKDGPTASAESAIADSGEQSEEKGPANALRALLDNGAELILPKDAGFYLLAMADELEQAIFEATGLMPERVNTASGGKTALYFGETASTPAEYSEGLGAGDFAVSAKDGAVYVTGGSDYAIGEAVNQMARDLLSEEKEVALPYIGRAQEGKEPLILRVGTFNIQNGGRVKHDFSVIAKDILDAGLDVVGLQEVDMFTARNKNQDTLKALSEATGYAYYEYSKTIDFDGGQYGHAILSRYPILSYETVLMSGGGERRAYGHAVIEIDGVKIDFFNSHFAWPEKNDRKTQFREITKVFNKCDLAILTADMNAVGTAEYEAFFKNVGYTNGNEGDFYHFISCPEDGAIDNVIFKDRFVLLSAKMENRVIHSDHYMVWAELALPRGN